MLSCPLSSGMQPAVAHECAGESPRAAQGRIARLRPMWDAGPCQIGTQPLPGFLMPCDMGRHGNWVVGKGDFGAMGIGHMRLALEKSVDLSH